MYRFERDERAAIFETFASSVTTQNHEIDDEHDVLLNYASVFGLNVSQCARLDLLWRRRQPLSEIFFHVPTQSQDAKVIKRLDGNDRHEGHHNHDNDVGKPVSGDSSGWSKHANCSQDP